MTVVINKNGNVRICLDARILNTIMVGDLESPPNNVEELLQKFHNAKYLTSIDLVLSYWQILLTEVSKKFVAFLYNGRSYIYQVLPFD